MTNWTTFASAAPELAAAVRARFEAHLHHVLATLRSDGSPRVSGTEARFHADDLYLGSMSDSRKGADLTRDGRYALHAATIDVAMGLGDAKVAGRVRRCGSEEAAAFLRSLMVDDHRREPGSSDEDRGEPDSERDDGEVFAAGISEATLTRVEGDLLVIDTWSESAGLRRIERR